MATEIRERDLKLLSLSKRSVKVLFCFYLTLIIAGIVSTVLTLYYYPTYPDKELLALISGLVMALSGSAVTYSRKLYSACINNTYSFYESADTHRIETELQMVGTLVFFIFRPFFGMAFSLVIYALWRLSISASGANELKFEAGFLYITMTLGFVSGFSAGRVIDMLEGYGARRIAALLERDD